MSGGRAVVVGASLAGLLAARVLTDHFDEVVIVERDRLPGGPDPRAGVPQSRHIHVLLVRGAQILERLFPGFRDELIRGGAPTVDWPSEILWLAPAGWVERTGASFEMISPAREILDWTVRNRVLASAKVRLLDAHDAVGLRSAGPSNAVDGLAVRARPDGGQVDLDADLVVDASGRTSKAPQWLEALGGRAPGQSVVNSFLGYSSRVYEPPDDLEADWKAIVVTSRPPHDTRAGVLFPLNSGLWHVTLVGTGRDYPPTDDVGFDAFAGSLRSPVLRDALAGARPVGPISGYRRTENQLRHYEKVPYWPRGFVALGDAVAAFNPVYGQGMTAAGISATVLEGWLRDEAPANLFQQRLARAVATPWLLATSEDYRFPTTEGGRPSPATRLMHRYLDRVIAVATVDDRVLNAFMSVAHLLQPPSVLFSPPIFARVMRGPRRAAPQSPPARPR